MMKHFLLLLLLVPVLASAKARPDTLWTRVISPSEITRAISVADTLSSVTLAAVCESPDGGIVMAATVAHSADAPKTIVIYKTDDNGRLKWIKSFRRGRSSWAADVQPARDGGYLVAATMESLTPELTQVWILRLNAEGDTLWTRMHRVHHYNSSRRVRETADGGFLIGLTARVSPSDPGMMSVIKFDSAGTPLWGKTYPDSLDIALEDIVVAQSGDFLLLGSAPGLALAYAVFADRQAGEAVWRNFYSGWADIRNGYETTDHKFLWSGNFKDQSAQSVPAMMYINSAGDSLDCRLFTDISLRNIVPLDDKLFAATGSGNDVFIVNIAGEVMSLRLADNDKIPIESVADRIIRTRDGGLVTVAATGSDLRLVKWSPDSINKLIRKLH